MGLLAQVHFSQIHSLSFSEIGIGIDQKELLSLWFLVQLLSNLCLTVKNF
jgi:hypothetical protein